MGLAFLVSRYWATIATLSTMTHTRIRPLPAACSTLLALLICLPAGARSAMKRTPAPETQLQDWVGHWHTQGESGGTPWHADTRCAWSVNHGFVVCDQVINDRIDQLMIVSYDEAAKAYRFSSIGKDRAPIVSFGTVHGQVWTNTGQFEQDGKKILMRTIVDFSVPHHYSDRETLSKDGGAHWIEASQGHATQVR